MSISESGVDDDDVGVFFNRELKEGEVIGVFAATCRDKSDIEGCNKLMHVVANLFGTFPGDEMEECLGLGMNYINDCSFEKRI